MKKAVTIALLLFVCAAAAAQEWWKPYSPPCTEREDLFRFAEKPAVKRIARDKYEITFAVGGACDVAVGVIDEEGKVVRHLGAGVLGENAPEPFRKSSLAQTVWWDGKDDLGRYPKHPERLRVRVMLGLKPVFDRRLGGTSPHNLPGKVWGVAIDPSSAYVFVYDGGGFKHMSARKFDRDGKYIRTLFPPPADMPKEKLTGTGCIEYEPGKRAWHGPDPDAIAHNGLAFAKAVNYKQAKFCQIAIAGTRIVFLNRGKGGRSAVAPSSLFYIYTDGSTDVNGMKGMPFGGRCHPFPRLAASPDGKWVYMISARFNKEARTGPAVLRAPADGSRKAETFLGSRKEAGSDNEHFNGPVGIDVDSGGRIYVSDSQNNRIQVFSPEGKYLKTIAVSRPDLVRVHQKTGAIYVQHVARVRGKSVGRLTKLTSFEQPTEEFHVDGISTAVMALDSWSDRPRLWLARDSYQYAGRRRYRPSLRILEEAGDTLRLMFDFDRAAKKEARRNYIGRWKGDCFDKVRCDPTREQVYYRNRRVFDLKTGNYLGLFRPAPRCKFDDMAFDKHGYAHLHFNPTFFGQGIGRVNPSRAKVEKDESGRTILVCPECPYDYGVQRHGWMGILPTQDQGGAKGFQDGLGVNMRGDVAAESNIYYVPRMEERGFAIGAAGIIERQKRGAYTDNPRGNYARYMKQVRDRQRRGEEIYFIRRKPGIPLAGGTVWTYDRTGELRRECAVIAGDLINGVQIDEDRSIYFVNARPKAYHDKPFLYGKGRVLGTGRRFHPFTGSLIKTAPDRDCRVLQARATIKMDELPKRPPGLLGLNWMNEANMGEGSWCWVEGAEWTCAGASPIVPTGCSCPRQHLELDWYRRVYVPEAYRHSIGILDTNGNLILHLGRYGNFDDAPGGKNGAGPGEEDIAMMYVRFVSVTDNYLVYGDWAEKLVVLRLDYHAEETAQVPKP
ncbi:MAG: hypothetical protein R6V58_09595 [Planctomycetota bacterium]